MAVLLCVKGTTVEVEYSLTPKDVIAFAHYHMDHPFPGQKRPVRWWVIVCLGVPIGGVWLWLLLTGGIDNAPEMTLIGCPLGMAVLLFLRLWPYRAVALATRKALREGRNAEKLKNLRLAIAPEGITVSSPTGAGTTPWTALERIALTPTHAFFYVTTREAHVLPRRVFPGEREFTEFVDTACKYRDAAWSAGPRWSPDGKVVKPPSTDVADRSRLEGPG
jgi:hypothetical protein